MNQTLQDTIPAFNKKSDGGGEVGISGLASSLGGGAARTWLEVFVIALVAVIIIGGGEFLLV